MVTRVLGKVPLSTPFDFTAGELYLDYQRHGVEARPGLISPCEVLIAVFN